MTGAPFALDGRTALVTGGASGIGAATAVALARAGADVALTWYPGDPHDPAPVVAEIERLGRKAIMLQGDVASTADVTKIVESTASAFGRLDIVVANAGVIHARPTADLGDEDWGRLLEINLGGVLRCFRAALPTMVAQGGGRLIATTSIAGIWGWPRGVHYAAAKSGIVGLVKSLAVEVGAHGITVNAVAPGTIVSPQSLDPQNALGPEGLEDFAQRVPLGRNGVPEDVAGAFVYLASDEASYVTGHVLVVDGGAMLCPR
jgi:3-oxoacyl-[acyl-carrier protein] reductase